MLTTPLHDGAPAEPRKGRLGALSPESFGWHFGWHLEVVGLEYGFLRYNVAPPVMFVGLYAPVTSSL